MPSAMWFGLKKEAKEGLKYQYDASGNISEITQNGHIAAKYVYDALGRLIREDNRAFGKTETYTYDKNGNILEKRTYTFPLLGDLEGQEYEGKKYTYDGDRLMKYGNETFAYDGVGNPTTYRGKSVSWINGRTMTAYDGISFTYDGRGGRTKKGNTEFTYSSGGKLLKQSDGLEFIYDASGVAGVIYNNATYLYRKDVQGNITALLDKDGKVVVEYKYDAWGNHAIVDASGNNVTSGIGVLNPFRYRGYLYDEETDLYYLQTRYYDPETGRFISQDNVSYLDPDSINGLNLYAYCANNPVMATDPTGTFVLSFFIACVLIGAAVGGALGGITAAENGTDIMTGVLTGALLGGAVGAVIGLGGAYVMGGISSVANKLFSDVVASAVSGTNCFGSWEDYAIAFVIGGLRKGPSITKFGKGVLDIAVYPLLTQVAKMGTRGTEFNWEKYIYDVGTRAATYKIRIWEKNFLGRSALLLDPGIPSLEISFGKAFMRGNASALWPWVEKGLAYIRAYIRANN